MTARRYMLPGGLLEEPGAKRSVRDWIVDVTMTVFAIAIALIVYGTSEKQHTEALILVDLVLGLAALIALWWRRRWPFAVALFAGAVGAVSAVSAGAGLFALFNIALRGSRRAIVISTVVGLAAGAIFPLIYPDDTVPYVVELVIALLFPLVVIPWGLFARTQRDLLRSSHERALQLEADQRARVDQAREAERRRIAGEMHDVLAHRLSLLSVHAGALEFRPDAPPAEIAEAAGVIRANAREALQELREVIGVLRSDADGVDPPQPTLDAIGSLIDESRAAGMKVNAHVGVEGGDVLLGRTAYRVVQEGLTNARKHAPAAAVEVTVAAADHHRGAAAPRTPRLVVEIVSRRSALAPEAGPGGSGLIGLAERVELVGGALEHGKNQRGDFVLRATLPWTA